MDEYNLVSLFLYWEGGATSTYGSFPWDAWAVSWLTMSMANQRHVCGRVLKQIYSLVLAHRWRHSTCAAACTSWTVIGFLLLTLAWLAQEWNFCRKNGTTWVDPQDLVFGMRYQLTSFQGLKLMLLEIAQLFWALFYFGMAQVFLCECICVSVKRLYYY